MADRSSIEWCDATWNPTRGCTKIAPECKNCYAETFAERFRGVPGHPYEQGFDPRLAPDKLAEPLKWRGPRRIFVDSMSDLFHEAFPLKYIAACFGVMAACPQHTFQVLTKRPERALEFFRWISRQVAVGFECLGALHPLAVATGSANQTLGIGSVPVPPGGLDAWPWPLPNVWLGVSVEDQTRADERIPILLQTPAAVRFLSVEPLLGPVDLRWYVNGREEHGTPFDGARTVGGCIAWTPPVDWVIVGGESGHGARPMHPDWPRSVRDQCVAAGVPYFFKQWGEWARTGSVDAYTEPSGKRKHPNSHGIAWLADGRVCLRDFTVAEHKARIRAGAADSTRAVEVDVSAIGDLHAAWARLDEAHRACGNGPGHTSACDDAATAERALGYEWSYHVGKKAAGRLLDGRTWDEYPTTREQEVSRG